MKLGEKPVIASLRVKKERRNERKVTHKQRVWESIGCRREGGVSPKRDLDFRLVFLTE